MEVVDDDEYPQPSGWAIALWSIVLLAVVAVGVLVVRELRSGDSSDGGEPTRTARATPTSTTTTAFDETTTTVRPRSTPTVTPDSVTVTSSGSTTDVSVQVAGPDPSSTTIGEPPPATLPDGTFQPVIAIFDTNTITLSGAVPSREASDLLATLAIANSKTPASVLNLLTIDPRVPLNVGVRVIELNSVRFPENSDEILPAHAVELDRVATVMNAFPNVSVLVIGHADQAGSVATNQAISQRRAVSVISYLESKGIAAGRLSARAVGESDLLTLNDDEASLALNRRTEFVFYGLLLGSVPA